MSRTLVIGIITFTRYFVIPERLRLLTIKPFPSWQEIFECYPNNASLIKEIKACFGCLLFVRWRVCYPFPSRSLHTPEEKTSGLNEILNGKATEERLVLVAIHCQGRIVNNLEPLMFILGKHVDLSSNFRCYKPPFSIIIDRPFHSFFVPAAREAEMEIGESFHIRSLINNNA